MFRTFFSFTYIGSVTKQYIIRVQEVNSNQNGLIADHFFVGRVNILLNIYYKVKRGLVNKYAVGTKGYTPTF